MRTRRIAIYALLALLSASAAFAAYQSGEAIIVTEPLDEDVYLAGRRIEVRAPLAADLVAAGQQIEVSAAVGGDVLAAGERVRLQAVRDDVRAAGRSVRLEGAVGGHVVAAGAEVVLTPAARVGDWAWLAGDEVRIDSRIGGELRVVARRVQIAGTIAGDAHIDSDRIELLPGARIEGDLYVQAAQAPTLDRQAVAGEIVFRQRRGQESPPSAASAAMAGLMALAVLATAAVVIYLLFPGFARRAATRLAGAPLPSLGLGFAVLAATPLLAVILLISGFGALLGLVLLVLYLLALPVGLWVGLAFLASRGLAMSGKPGGRGWGALAMLLAVVLVALLQLIPVLGGLAVFVLLLLGLGAASLQLWRQYRAAPAGE